MRRISAVPPALCVALALACTAQSGPAPKPKPEAAGEEPTKPNEPVSKTMRLDAAAIAAEVQSTLDASADPCDNFYKYACGGWLTSTTRPPDKPRYGRGFGVVDEKNKAILREILAPALCLVGALDEETPVVYSRHLASHLPHGTLEVVPGAGHLLNVEAPDIVNRLIRQHLETVEASE